MGPVTGSGATGVAPQEWTTPPAEPERGEEETATITAGKSVATDSATTGWWWALPGLTIGAALALLIRPWATHLPATVAAASWRRREEGPRQELRDVDDLDSGGDRDGRGGGA